jgi:hypothetical protein
MGGGRSVASRRSAGPRTGVGAVAAAALGVLLACPLGYLLGGPAADAEAEVRGGRAPSPEAQALLGLLLLVAVTAAWSLGRAAPGRAAGARSARSVCAHRSRSSSHSATATGRA